MKKFILDTLLMILMMAILIAMVNVFGLTATTVGSLAYLLEKNIFND